MSLDPARDARNQEAMRAHRLDALICRLPENVLLLTGYWPLSSFAFAVTAADGASWLIVPNTEERYIPQGVADEVRIVRSGVLDAPDPYDAVQSHLGDALRTIGIERGRIGYEAGFESVAPGHGAGEVLVPGERTASMLRNAAPDAEWVSATPTITAARARKTSSEIAKLRRANAVATLGLDAFRASYEPGRREAEVAAQIEAAIMAGGIGYEGAEHARAWAQLMTGPEAARAYSMHPATSARVIEWGDLGVLELGTVVDGYWSDLTRTLVAGGRPDERQTELYAAILAAHRAMMAAARPGMTGGEIDALARDEIDRRGFGRDFVHQTGHGLGFRYHEAVPTLHPDNRDPVEEGMVSSMEPGIYIEGYGGMRLEENVVFTPGGVELLSVWSTEL